MATPFLQLQTNIMNIVPGTPGSVKFLSKDVNGAAVDLSSGYTLTGFITVPTGARNADASAVDLHTNVSASFGTTGLTLSWTAAESISISNALQMLSNVGSVSVSNDGGTTTTVIASPSVQVNNINGML